MDWDQFGMVVASAALVGALIGYVLGRSTLKNPQNAHSVLQKLYRQARRAGSARRFASSMALQGAASFAFIAVIGYFFMMVVSE